MSELITIIEDNKEFNEFVHFDEDENSFENEVKQFPREEKQTPLVPIPEGIQLNHLTDEETNHQRLVEIETIKQNMDFGDLGDLMRDLKTNNRESQKTNMFIPTITNKDFAGIMLMETAADPRYTYSVSSGVDVWRRKVNGSTWNGVARTIIPNITPKRMCELYWNYNLRRKWDSFYTVIEDIEILPNRNKVSRTATWTPKMFKQRDYVHVREVIETDDCCVGVYLPAEHDKAPIGMNGFIRGYVNFSGFVFRKRGKDCLCTLMTQTDISIPLPDFLINKFVALAIRLYVKLMKKAALEQGNKPN